jgi:hypothetical protein
MNPMEVLQLERGDGDDLGPEVLESGSRAAQVPR